MEFKETEATELKERLNDTFEKALVAFLNTMDGTIYIGVKDSGEVVGVQSVDAMQRDIADIITTRILPNPQSYTEVGSVYVDGKSVVTVKVKKGCALYYIKRYGRSAQGCFVRIGTSCRSMTEEQIEESFLKSVVLEEKSIKERRASRQTLTFRILKQYLIEKGYHINEETFAKNFSLLTANGEYNELAELLADENNISIKVAVFKGKDKTQFLKRNEYGFQSLIVALEKVVNYCDAINETYVEVGERAARKETRMFNMKAFREAWINACVHNDWKQGVPPAVYIFDDRLEIHSIGGIPKGSDREKFLRGESVPVNKELMQIFIMLEIVEQTGHGVPIVVDKYGESAFSFDNNFIVVTIPFNRRAKHKVAHADDTISDTLNGDDTLNDIKSDTLNGDDTLNDTKSDTLNGTDDTLNDTIKDTLNDDDTINVTLNADDDTLFDTILELLRRDDSIGIKEIAIETGKSRATINRTIKRMKTDGILEREGSKKTGKWKIIK